MYKTLLVLAALAAPVALIPKALVGWDKVTTDIAGNPCVVTAYEIGLFSPTGGFVKSILANSNAYTGTQLAALLNGVEDGSYVLRVRAQGANGLWSEWSLPLEGVISTVAPTVPQNVKVR